MRTYSKRHKRQNNVLVDDQTSRKRVRHSETEGHSRKRKKLVDPERPTMSGIFETPHPTLEVGSHVYKLPSTKPIPSPTPFSPVPITVPAQSLKQQMRPYLTSTTSGRLKENKASNKSIRQRRSSTTLSSFTLTSGPRPASRKTLSDGKPIQTNIPIDRECGNQTRSPSRSSASSSSRSRGQTRLSKFKSKLIKKSKSKPNATINGLSERRPTNAKQAPKSSIKRRKSELLISDDGQNVLASPFTSRAPSPTNFSNAEIANPGSSESPASAEPTLNTWSRGLSKVHIDLNVPRTLDQSFRNKRGRLSQVCDGFSSPEQTGSRKQFLAKLFNRGRNENSSLKNRRPSAPSDLQRPPKLVGKAHVPRGSEKTRGKRSKQENEINRHTNKFQVLTRSVNPSTNESTDGLKLELTDNLDPFSWMQERSAVDFNRPPSQLSFHLSSGFYNVELDAEVDGVFWSSGEDNDEDDQRRLSAKLKAAGSAWFNSTPYKTVIARRTSVPILEGSSIALTGSQNSGKARSMSMSASTKTEIPTAVGDDDKSGEDMELTAPLGRRNDSQNDSMSLQDHTPWITDSIISPPTAYYERPKSVVNVEEKGAGMEEQPVSADQNAKVSITPPSSMVRTQLLSSPFGSSGTESTSVAESTSHEPVACGNQEQKEDKGALQGPSQRTRSGTILASRSGATIARRTRTGTIVGPSANGRMRSGTIVANVKGPEQNAGVGGSRRTRSGSIIAPVSDLNGKKGVSPRTGSVTKLETKRISDVSRVDEVQAKETRATSQIENSCSGNGCAPSIQEVNEAECYVDSLYLTSSPDPINFLTGARIDGDESALVVVVGEWQVADEPPSPEIKRTKKTAQTPRGVGRSMIRRFKPKGNRKKHARFLGPDGEVESFECDDPKRRSLNFEDGLIDTSDDELLLVVGQSKSLPN